MSALVILFSYCFNMDGLRYEQQQNELLRQMEMATKPPTTITIHNPTQTLQHDIDNEFDKRNIV